MIILKTPDEIAVMAKASRVVAEVLEVLKKAARATSPAREPSVVVG